MPELNQAAPDFSMFDHERNRVSLADLRGTKVVLAFYPAAFTGVCEKEMCTFQSSLTALNDANAKVFGVSVDAPFANAAFAAQNGIAFGLLSDYDRSAVSAYGIAHDDFAGMPGYTVAKRSVFVIDENGQLTFKWVADNPGQEPDYAAVLAAVA